MLEKWEINRENKELTQKMIKAWEGRLKDMCLLNEQVISWRRDKGDKINLQTLSQGIYELSRWLYPEGSWKFKSQVSLLTQMTKAMSVPLS